MRARICKRNAPIQVHAATTNLFSLSFFSHFLSPHPLVSGLCFIAHTRKERFLRHTRVHNKFARAPVWCNRRSPLSIISAAQSAKLSLNSSCLYEIYQRARARLCLMRYTKLVARRCDACINYGEQQVFSIRGVGKATPWCGASEKREKETRAALYINVLLLCADYD